MTGPGELVERLRARYGWLDRVLRAEQRYSERRGDFYAAGLTYYTIFALFPVLMVGFGVGGFLLARRPDLLAELDARIRGAMSAPLSEQLTDLIDAAIDSRTSVGLIGLAVAGWAGLTWMDKLREALSQMWEQYSVPPPFLRRKLSDLAALVSAFLAALIAIGLVALADPALMAAVLKWLGIPHVSALGGVLRAVSLLMSLLVAWLMFTWIIARLPREPVGFTSSLRAGLLAAVGFEVFQQAASVYLRSVLNGPAGVVFGPVLGLMVFAYVTARLVLFAAAFAATSGDATPASQRAPAVEPAGEPAVEEAPAVRRPPTASGSPADLS